MQPRIFTSNSGLIRQNHDVSIDPIKLLCYPWVRSIKALDGLRGSSQETRKGRHEIWHHDLVLKHMVTWGSPIFRNPQRFAHEKLPYFFRHIPWPLVTSAAEMRTPATFSRAWGAPKAPFYRRKIWPNFWPFHVKKMGKVVLQAWDVQMSRLLGILGSQSLTDDSMAVWWGVMGYIYNQQYHQTGKAKMNSCPYAIILASFGPHLVKI